LQIKTILILIGLFLLTVVVVVGYISRMSYLESPEYFQKQLTLISQKIAKKPKNPQAYYERGLLILNNAQIKGMNVYLGVQPSNSLLIEAESDFAKANELDPDNLTYLLALADMRASRFSRNLKSIALFYTIENQPILQTSVTKKTSDQFSLPKWSEVFVEESDPIVSAFKWAEIATSIQPSPHNLVRHGILTFARGDHQNGIDFISKAIDNQLKQKIDPKAGKSGTRYPTVVSDLLVRATCYLVLKKSQLALDDLNKAVDLWPYYADLYVYRAYIKEYLQDKSGAINDLKNAIEQRPGWRGDYEKLIELYKN